jgi:hypothetical protein
MTMRSKNYDAVRAEIERRKSSTVTVGDMCALYYGINDAAMRGIFDTLVTDGVMEVVSTTRRGDAVYGRVVPHA